MGLFDEQVSLKPNNYPWTQEIIDAIWTSHWTPNEFNFRADYGQFHSEMSPQQQQVIVRTLAAIGQIEIAVKRFWGDLGRTFRHPSISDMGYVLAGNEVIHGQAYPKLLDVLNLQHVFDEMLKEPVIEGRVRYLKKYLEKVYEDDRKQYVYALILFTLFIENTSLFGQFYIILNFNRYRNVLKDTAQQVNYTLLEESVHTQAGIMLIKTLREEYPEMFDQELENRVREEVENAIIYEGWVIDWIMGDYTDVNLSADIVKAYVKNRLNEAIIQVRFDPLPISEDELSLLPQTLWMEEEIKGELFTDFFSQKPTSYTKNHRSFTEEELF